MLTLPLTAPVPIRRSKLEPPLVSGHFVRRRAVESRLDRALACPLTVIVAPAGHGKTRTIVEWLRARDLDAAWVTLDDRDGDFTRFATHIAAALDRPVPGIAAELFRLLSVPHRLPPHDLGEAFGDALYDLKRDVVLVLDDLHTASTSTSSSAGVAFLSGLLAAAPRRLHTILSSRGRPPLPLARLRTTGDVVELTGADLRFSSRETVELLQLETRGTVAPEIAATIHAAVGGWPAAIRLIAISRWSAAEIPSPLAEESEEQLLLGYLGEEVLSRLPPWQRELLLRASLLERFNAPLLEALMARQDGNRLSRADLERLRALELFREIPGLGETWYAYHPLFRDILRHELERVADAAAIADLHGGAARWFAEAGFTLEAVRHLVTVGDVSAAAALIESRANAAFDAEDWHSIAGWLRLIPMAEIRQRPELLLASAWVAFLSGRSSRIAEVLQTMRDPHVRRLANEAQQAEIALIAETDDVEPDRWAAIAERAIAAIPQRKRYRYGYAHMALAMALTESGRADEALARIAAFTERESARIDAASIRGYFARALVLIQSGRLTQCEQTAADQWQLATMNGLPVTAGWGACLLGVIAHERGQLDQADRHLAAVIADADRLHFECVRESFFAQILAYEARGMRREAELAIARLRELAIAIETPRQLARVDSMAARVALIRGDLDAVRRWLAATAPPSGRDGLMNVEYPALTRIKAQIAIGTAETLADADRLLTTVIDLAKHYCYALALQESLAVQALLHEARGEATVATRVLRESLAMAAPEGIVQPFALLGPGLAPILRRLLAGPAPVPHARNVLTALNAVIAAHPAVAGVTSRSQGGDLPHPLSARELDVLRCLARRLTNDEIGGELFISPITVKHHVANISGKLAVSGRRAAVARASEMGLLG